MVGTIWGRLEMNSSMSDMNVAIGCCGHLYTVRMHIVQPEWFDLAMMLTRWSLTADSDRLQRCGTHYHYPTFGKVVTACLYAVQPEYHTLLSHRQFVLLKLLLRSEECFSETHDVGMFHGFISDDVFMLCHVRMHI